MYDEVNKILIGPKGLGLAYYVGAQNVVGLAPGYFAFYAGTAPDKVALVEGELLSEAELQMGQICPSIILRHSLQACSVISPQFLRSPPL